MGIYRVKGCQTVKVAHDTNEKTDKFCNGRERERTAKKKTRKNILLK